MKDFWKLPKGCFRLLKDGPVKTFGLRLAALDHVTPLECKEELRLGRVSILRVVTDERKMAGYVIKSRYQHGVLSDNILIVRKKVINPHDPIKVIKQYSIPYMLVAKCSQDVILLIVRYLQKNRRPYYQRRVL